MLDNEHISNILSARLWYLKWSIVFTIASIVVELVGLWQIIHGDIVATLRLLALAGVVSILSHYLRAKSDQSLNGSGKRDRE